MPIYSSTQELEIKAYRFHFIILIILSGMLIMPLFGRLVYLQIYQGSSLYHQSQINRYKTRFLRATRGLILDRNQKVLIGNQPINNLKINLNDIKDKDSLLKELSSIINTSSEILQQRIKKQVVRHGSYHPITLKNNLNLQEIYKLKLLQWEYPEIYVEETNVRIYPLKDNGSHIFGYADEVSSLELKQLRNETLHPMDIVGKQGLEKQYDSYLRGRNGWSYIEVDALNRITPQEQTSQLQIQEPEKGNDIVLTIDQKLQQFVYKTLIKRNPEIKSSVIVMKTNGEILAWVNIPSFDPNMFSYKIDQKQWLDLSKNSSQSFLNKGLQEHYSPGSTIKPFVAIASLSEGLITKDQKINSPSRLKFGNRYFHDHKILGYGNINVIQAIEESANTFFYQIANDLGIDKMSYYLSLFGFGKKTNINLSGEIAGVLPTKNWKKKKFNTPWTLGDTINTSIGQGFMLTTLLQLSVAYNVIATEGLVVKPFLIKNMSDNKTPKEENVVDTLTDRIDRDHFITIKEALRQVVEGSQGTARFWRSRTADYGGKTGTSQVISMSSKQLYKKCNLLPLQLRHHGLFISFAPVVNSEIVVSVLIENSCAGAWSAPIARDIIDYYMKNKNKETS